jgi:hypothetical protein
VATSTNKRQPKQWKTHNRKTPNVDQGSTTWTLGAKQKINGASFDVKNLSVFIGYLKIIKVKIGGKMV